MPYFVDFDPVFVALGPLKIHWYGIMYLLGFMSFLALGNLRSRDPAYGWSKEEVGDFLLYGALGVVLGGRIGYILFYDMQAVLADPHRIYQIWKGGMSFHGGFLGVLVAIFWFQRRTGKPFHRIADFVMPLVPPGLFFGRIGNFIGGELWGRLTDSPLGMIFPKAIDPARWDSPALLAQYHAGQLNDQARHPSQLYEALLEGLLLFVIVWLFSRRQRPPLAVSGLLVMGYGVFRSFVEWFRQPDYDIGFIYGDWLTMGQLLSWPLILAGAAMLIWAYAKRADTGSAA